MVMNSCKVQGLLNLKAVGIPLPAKKITFSNLVIFSCK